MNLFGRRARTICMCNVIVPFVCTGFLGIKTDNGIITGSTTDEAHEISLTASDTEPASQCWEGEENKLAFITDGIEAVIDQQEFTGPLPIQEEGNDFAFVTDGIEAVINQRESATKTVKTTKKTTKKSTTKKTTSTSSNKKTTTRVVTKKEVASSNSYAKPTNTSKTGDAVVAYARKFMGLRYVRAGRSLKTGTDCSGFTMLIYREFGVSLPGTVGGQIGRGTYVSKSNLQKGDLVFYKAKGSKGGASHVGIYIGGGQVIHESKPGVGVKISTVNMMQYVTARRVINGTATKIAEKKAAEQKQTAAKTDNTTNTQVTATPTPIINNEEKKEIVNNNVVDNKNNNVTATTAPTVSSVETKQEVKADTLKEEKVEVTPKAEVKVENTPKAEVKKEIKEESKEEVKETTVSNTESN